MSITPGVGEYDLQSSTSRVKEQSPRAVIGKNRRFEMFKELPGVGDYNVDKSTD